MSIDTTRRQRPGVIALISALALLILLGSGCSDKETATPEATAPAEAPAAEAVEPEAAPAEEAEPAAEPAMEAEPAAEPEAAAEPAAEAVAAAADGEKIYKGTCLACHAAGVANAPKLGDKAAWAPRIAKGDDALLSSVTKGLNAMPPKGGCMTCSEDDLRAAVAYMVGQGS